ncbi:hypothetical protein F5B21DRAFT_514972 [Xylaria acuta]|nr:hypothetical protein F5B21DRAFT_514972 [Xylaria acuta]
MATAEVESVQPVPSHVRCVPGSVNIKPAKFPSPTRDIEDLDPSKVASNLVGNFNRALDKKDYSAIANLFVEDGYWRGHLALSWGWFRLRSMDVDAGMAVRSPKIITVDASGSVSSIQFFIRVTTVLGTGVGLVQLVEQGGQWKIFTLYTRLEELREHEEAVNHRRTKGAERGGKPGRKYWAEKRVADADFKAGNEPAVLVIGAGQAGLTVAARLRMLGVDTFVIDQNERVGDNWRKHYHQLVLHDPVYSFEPYAALLELNVWTKTELVYTKWDEEKKIWTVIVNRKREDGMSDIRTFHPRHLIQATGHSGKKNQPSMKGIENFKGDRLCHSSEFTGARENSQGKKVIVVGSCNSVHDIAQDFLEKGYEITIVQRIYSEDGPPVDDADILPHGLPTAQAECDKEILDGLDRAGFKVDRGPDGAGLFFKYFQRGGGYYIDVGPSQLIADGKIKAKQGQEIHEVLPHGLWFQGGTELGANEMVFATGYQNMRTQTRLMFGDEVADRVGDGFGFGGNLAICRYYSKLLPLQIKGLEEGLFQDDEI